MKIDLVIAQRSRRRGLLLGVVGCLATGSVLPAADSATAAPTGCGSATTLAAVAMANAGVGWAAGTHASGDGNVAVLRRFQGGSWSPVDVPLPKGSSSFYGVSAASATAAVVVGQVDSGSVQAPGPRPIALEWNGVSWAPLSMQGAPSHGALYAVSALGLDDVWAAGLSESGGSLKPLVIHWNGTIWQRADLPRTRVLGWFNAISAASPSNVWAVGTVGIQNYAVHWNGTAWVRHDQPIGWGSVLNGVAPLGGTQVMAVGWYGVGQAPRNRALAQTWNGNAWERSAPRELSARMNVFNGLGVGGPDDIWAVGVRKTATGQQIPLAQHWDGHRWVSRPVPYPGGASQLRAVATVSDSDAWAVGGRGLRSLHGCLLMHWDGTSWTAT